MRYTRLFDNLIIFEYTTANNLREKNNAGFVHVDIGHLLNSASRYYALYKNRTRLEHWKCDRRPSLSEIRCRIYRRMFDADVLKIVVCERKTGCLSGRRTGKYENKYYGKRTLNASRAIIKVIVRYVIRHLPIPVSISPSTQTTFIIVVICTYLDDGLVFAL